jgi:hypothetical protein
MLLQELMKNAEIAAPCSADWDSMMGNNRMRFCQMCELHVLNAEMMTDEEVLATLQGLVGGRKACLRLYRRQDGTFLTKNCPVGLEKIRERSVRMSHRVAACFSGIVSSLLSCAAVPAENQTTGNEFSQKPTWSGKVSASSSGGQHSGAQVNGENAGLAKKPERGNRFGGAVNVWKVEVKQTNFDPSTQEAKVARLRKEHCSKHAYPVDTHIRYW